MSQVQAVACTNNAWFVMNFSIRWLDVRGIWNTTAWNSGNFSKGVTRVSPDLASIGVPVTATLVTPYVHAILGKYREGSTPVTYQPNRQVAVYQVKGTALDYNVKLIRYGPSSEMSTLVLADRN